MARKDPGQPGDVRDPDYAARVRSSFARQAFMSSLGASLEVVEPGVVSVSLPFRSDLTQQHGYLHAGAVTAIADTACGYAALTLMEREAAVLSVEFKINLLAPARGNRLVATARVLRSGRTLTVCASEVRAQADASDAGAVVAVMQATMMAVRDRPGMAD